jgi:alpha-glutamyl/putrescinyl thymine pyrophosphorylase clade 1
MQMSQNSIRPSPPITSVVYDTYWRFACERQEIYFRKLDGSPSPWTEDAILRAHRFTNVYRAADRVSQYLIRRVIYSKGESVDPDEILFRVLLFKFFNRIETWELLERELHSIRWSAFSFKAYDRILTRAIDSGKRIYSAAYIMPVCNAYADGRKHRSHLRLIEKIVRDGMAQQLTAANRMADVFNILRTYPMLGDFLAFQLTIDLNYSPLTDFSEGDFVVPGPGARDGLRKVFVDPGGFREADLIRYVADRQEEEFTRRGLRFRSLWGRRLQLIDCQNVFCEIDKYARIRHPDVLGKSGRMRIKQKYNSNGSSPAPWFPPKWELNEKIRCDRDKLPSERADEGLFRVFA